MKDLRQNICDLLASADIHLNGDRPWDMQVHNDGLFKRVMAQGALGLGEAYMDGWWDVKQLDQFACKVLLSGLKTQFTHKKSLPLVLLAKLVNMQKLTRAHHVGEQHYNLGNDFFRCMLDERLTYTCGYWKQAKDLNTAQVDKLDLVCRKLNLQPGQHVLDIGCGWGSFAGYAAEYYGAKVTGITISTEQAKYANERYKDFPIDIRVQDYRQLDQQFDHIVSLGMLEHVGLKNYSQYFKIAAHCLKDEGLFLLHSIGTHRASSIPDPWIHKYIFPNGMLPSLAYLAPQFEKVFVLEDLHNFGAYYDTTLLAWFENFEQHWVSSSPYLKDNFDERFYRMWKYYLLSCAGAFRARDMQLWQCVLSKQGVSGVYKRIV